MLDCNDLTFIMLLTRVQGDRASIIYSCHKPTAQRTIFTTTLESNSSKLVKEIDVKLQLQRETGESKL